MYKVKFSSHFDSAHFLRNYNGKCANIHGHRWEIEGQVSGEKLNDIGILIDFHDLKKWLNEVCDGLDHRILNEVEGFRESQMNPTAENIASYIFHEMKIKIKDHYTNDVKLVSITVWESPNCGVTYSELI